MVANKTKPSNSCSHRLQYTVNRQVTSCDEGGTGAERVHTNYGDPIYLLEEGIRKSFNEIMVAS